MYLIRKIKEDGSYMDSYHHDINMAIIMMNSWQGRCLIMDLNKPKGYASFEIVKSKP